ncbi:MAG TPA: 4-hydroxythreonine-4-phosphate dehydrogenase PdxA, partial [Pirellulales bacterium]|nr:4-hydroxythreonine-4-phosphate dehydrogenase PdxA [Pirellulales bacterium]
MKRPVLALTVGDPAGVGPEVIVGAWRAIHDVCRPIAVGHPQVLRRAADLLGTSIDVREIRSVAEAESSPDVLCCLRSGSDDVLDVPPATIDPRAGQAAYDALRAATQLALADEIDGIVTAPLHKKALWEAGHHYPGHTEMLAEFCGVSDFAMMLYLPPSAELLGRAGLGVVHVTLHMALRDVWNHL